MSEGISTCWTSNLQLSQQRECHGTMQEGGEGSRGSFRSPLKELPQDLQVAKGSDPAQGERQKLRRGQGEGEVRHREEIGSAPGYEIISRS